MISPEKFLNLIKEDEDEIFKLGTVANITEGKAKIKFDGEEVESGKSYLSAGLMPGVGGRVLLAQVKGTYLILGGIGSGGVVDNLESTSASSALSANMGRELFQYANNGKTLIANAIVGIGGSASPNDTFQQLASKIGSSGTGKKTASGINSSASNGNLLIRNMGFAPNIFIATSGVNEIFISWTNKISNAGVIAFGSSPNIVNSIYPSVSSRELSVNVPANRSYNWFASE